MSFSERVDRALESSDVDELFVCLRECWAMGWTGAVDRITLRLRELAHLPPVLPVTGEIAGLLAARPPRMRGELEMLGRLVYELHQED